MLEIGGAGAVPFFCSEGVIVTMHVKIISIYNIHVSVLPPPLCAINYFPELMKLLL